MDDDTLWANYYGAVCHYIEQNGADPDDTQFSLVDGGDKKIRIATWTYNFQQPSDDTLRDFKLADVQASAIGKAQSDAIQARRLPGMTDTQRDRIAKRKLANGDVIFNRTTKRLEIFIDDSWHGIATVPE
jgi:hypothetical protein